VPRVLALIGGGVADVLGRRARPLGCARVAAASEMIEALRDLRRAGDEEIVLRDALIEDGARALALTNRTAALAIDVTERSTSLVLARPDGRVEAAHLVEVGEVGADQRTHAAGNIRERRRVRAR